MNIFSLCKPDVSRIFRLSKEGLWIVLGQVLSTLGLLVLVRVLTNYLAPAQYGQLALGLTVAGLVNQVITGGIVGSISRFYAISVEKNDVQNYLRASTYMMAYSTILVCGVAGMMIFGLWWAGYSKWIVFATLTFIFSLLSAYNSALRGIQDAARQRAISVLHSSMDIWLKILLAVLVMAWFHASETSVIIGYSCSSFIVLASQSLFLRRLVLYNKTSLSNTLPWIKKMWTYSWPFSTWGLFTWMQQVSDRWALELFSNSDDVGMYAVLFQLSYAPISILAGMMTGLLTPIIYQRAGDLSDDARLRDVYRLTGNVAWICLIGTGTAFALGLCVHSWVFQLFVNQRYHAISYLFPWMLLASGFISAHHIIGIRMSCILKTQTLIVPQIIMALLAVMLNILGAWLGHLVGLVAANVLFALLYFLWIVWFSNGFLRRMTEKEQDEMLYTQETSKC